MSRFQCHEVSGNLTPSIGANGGGVTVSVLDSLDAYREHARYRTEDFGQNTRVSTAERLRLTRERGARRAAELNAEYA